MEGTQPKAIRKRRSSILKSQRALRTPFSELEFNVATPTDSAKSRRVSFSSRTGVAEFVTNEATTTWKNVYEEQNKSLESSGQDSGPGRPSTTHLGSRGFDQLFQDVEADNIEFGAFDGPGPSGPFNQSLHLNVTEQLALIETTELSRKLSAPSQQFELSEFTEQPNLFQDELSNPTNNVMSNVQVNFSALQAVTNCDTDVLDDMERDLDSAQPGYLVCQGPSGADVSQHIDIDLNTTLAQVNNSNVSDMSITDTISNPAKALPSVEIRPVASWIENKENIVVNPYVAPDEAAYFATRESPEKVLVFDGKKLKYAAIDDDLDELEDPKDTDRSKGPGSISVDGNQSKKVLYADLNSAESSKTSLNINSASNKTLVYTASGELSSNTSMTGVVNVAQMKRQTKIFSLDDGDMSMTKCLTNTQQLDQQVDLVVTQALTKMLKESFESLSPSNMYVQEILTNMVEKEAVLRSLNSNEKPDTKRQTIVFDDNGGDLSMTACVPNEMLSKLSNKKSEASINMSMTKVVSNDVLKCLANQNAELDEVEISSVDMSMTTALPNDVLETLVTQAPEELETANMSMTNALPNHILADLATKPPDDNDLTSTNNSDTIAIPSDIIANLVTKNINSDKMDTSDHMSMTEAVPNEIIKDLMTEKRSSEEEKSMRNFEASNISMTEAVPNEIINNLMTEKQSYEKDNPVRNFETSNIMSMTEALPNEIIKDLMTEKRSSKEEKSMRNFETSNISMTEAVPNEIIEKLMTEASAFDGGERNFETSVVEMDISDVNMSLTKTTPHSLLVNIANSYLIPEKESAPQDQTRVSDFNMSMTKPIPNQILLNLAPQSQNPEDIEPLVCPNKRRRTILFQDTDVSMTEAIPTNLIEAAKDHDVSNISVASTPVSEHVSFVQSNRKTIDIHEKPTHRKSVLTDDTRIVTKTILFEDVSNQTLAVSRNITKILSRQMSPEKYIIGKSPKRPDSPPKSPEPRVTPSKSPEPRKSTLSPNKSYTRASRYSAGKRPNSSRSTSPDKDNKLLNLEKVGDKKRRSRTPETPNTSARYNTPRKSRASTEKRSMNPFTNPSKATSPERTALSPKRASMKPYQILNKATSPDKKKFETSFSQGREVLVYQTVNPKNPRERPGGTSPMDEVSTTSTSVESTTTPSEHIISSKSTTDISDIQEMPDNVDRTLHFYNQATVQPELSEESGQKQKAPSSKGDEFQKSSQKLNCSLPGITKLENPQLERRKTMPSKAESKFEEPIKSIAYDQLDSISKKSMKTPQLYLEQGCQPETASTTPELVSETTSFHPSEVTSQSKDESLTAVATTKEISCDAMTQEFIVQPSQLPVQPVCVTEDVGLDPPSQQLVSYANYPTVLETLVTATGTQKTPSESLVDVESVKTSPTVPKSSSSNESCKTLTDSTEVTSEDEPHKPSETSTKTLLNNLLDMSDISFPTNCAEVAPAGLKSQIVPENFNRTVCGVTGSPYLHQRNDELSIQKNKRQVSIHSPTKIITASDVKKKITFSDRPKQMSYQPTDSDTNESNDPFVQRPILNKYFDQNQTDDSDASTVTDDKPSKLLDIISVLTHPDADTLTSTTSSESRPEPSKKIVFNLCDTDDTSQVSIVQDGKLLRVHDSDSTETDITTLRKPAYSSSDYSNNKVNVIPSRYYDDVAENVNDLMKDLVKPRSDGYPFEDAPFPRSPRKSPSICSTQVQATLATSSQVDLEALPYDSLYEMSQPYQDSVAHEKPLKGIMKLTASGELSSGHEDEYDTVTLRLQKHKCETNDDRVLVFDSNNPLNNIMIAPIDFSEAHQYNPESDVDTSETEENQMAVKSVEIHPKSSVQAEDAVRAANDALKNSIIECRDTEVNTVVAMKGTKELLDANSSLTLVDEPVGRRFTDSDLLGHKRKRMQVLFKSNTEEDNLEKSFLGRLVQRDHKILSDTPAKAVSPPKPRGIKSPAKSPRSPAIEVPKFKISLRSDPSSASTAKSTKKPREDGVHKSRKKSRSPVTIQQFMTQFGAPGDVKTMDQQQLLAMQECIYFSSSGSDIEHDKRSMAKSMEMIASFTSNRSSMKYSESLDSKRLHSSRKSLGSGSDWLPELLNEMSSKNLLSECDSGVNVVAQIDMLPFMGSRECEWEASGSDTWTFKLLHGRLRLSLRLAHRLDNSPRRLVRADTPVKALRLEPTHHEKRNTVASLCVRYAAEAMLVTIARGCARAGAVPPLLRRCAAIARVALRWGTAMHEAKVRLAFTIQDNIIALKVANIPLRSVWEVTLRVDMAAAGAPDAPWPAATDVRVAPVVSDCDVTPHDVERALAGINRDWGHVPKTIWKIFRFLKTKTRDDDVLKYVH